LMLTPHCSLREQTRSRLFSPRFVSFVQLGSGPGRLSPSSEIFWDSEIADDGPRNDGEMVHMAMVWGLPRVVVVVVACAGAAQTCLQPWMQLHLSQHLLVLLRCRTTP